MPESPSPKLRPPHPAVVPPAQVGPSPHPYAELSVTTNFSFLRGASHPDELVATAAAQGHRAVAVTDLNSVAGVVRAHQAAREVGLRLIVGARLTFSDAPDLLVWVPDRPAYARLCRLLTLGKRRAEKGRCSLSVHDFLGHADGLLAAVVPTDATGEESGHLFSLLRDTLGRRLSLAACRQYGTDDGTHLRRLAGWSHRFRIPLVAVNHVHYHDPSRRPLQDVLTCVRHGCTIHDAGYRLFPNAERCLKPPEQMHRLFAGHPHALRRTIEIAEQCTFSLDELRYEYPREIVPEGATPSEHLAKLTWEGAAARYPGGPPGQVRRQIEHELDLIRQLGFEPYFLTVHDLVRFARSRDILCQGRGSAANSAVCYCLGVTAVDPARSDLLFERFISAARNEPPDIDIDFEHERREEVIQYVYEKYGRERAGMTAEIITYRGRSAVRDVGKALGLSPDMVDQMAKKLDGWHRGTLEDAHLRECGLDPTDRTVRQVVAITSQLLGFPRHLSQHVGGMVMTRGAICELVPIENASMPGRTVIEWDKDDIDALGILKVDLLALGMLTCIAKCLALVNPGRAVPLELYNVPAEDPAVYAMVSRADTIGVFQIESRAQMSMLPRLRPKTFYDLVIEVAIVRPGPIQGDMVHPYLRRREGTEPVTYPSEALRQVLGKTLGVPLFQEQVMKVAMVAAGFSAEEADRLRRAMAAWKRHGGLDAFRAKIIAGMLANGYTRDFAEQCFRQIQGFGEYGFPESHAASFALLVYVSAWLKCHHPAAFACALLNSQPMGFYAPAQIVRDAADHGVEVRPIDVNHSDWDCTLEDRPVAPPALRLGLRLIRGLQHAHGDRLVSARRRTGRFTSLPHLRRATGLRRHTLQRLAQADAFGSLGLTRREGLWQALALTEEQLPLFDDAPLPDHKPSPLPPMTLGQEVLTDFATTTLSLKRHPVALVRDKLRDLKIRTAAEVMQMESGWIKVAGVVMIRQRPGTASGIVFVTLEDETGVVNLILRPDVYDRYRPAARHAHLLQADGYVERQGMVVHVLAKRLHDLSPLLHGFAVRSRDFH